MLRFERSGERWWQKPLVLHDGRVLPAELAVLELTLRDGEEGAWLNSQGTETAVTGFERTKTGDFQTDRSPLPTYVAERLCSFYDDPRVSKGVYDLVIWSKDRDSIRFVEVKCPHWDRPSEEQLLFAQVASARGIPTEVVEWEFTDHGG